MKGVERVQPALVVPVTVRFGDAEEDVSLTAMQPDADFHGFVTSLQGAPPADALARRRPDPGRLDRAQAGRRDRARASRSSRRSPTIR